MADLVEEYENQGAALIDKYMNEKGMAYEIYAELAKEVQSSIANWVNTNTEITPSIKWVNDFEIWLKEQGDDIGFSYIIKMKERFRERVAEIAKQVAKKYDLHRPDVRVSADERGKIKINWLKGVLSGVSYKKAPRQLWQSEIASMMGGWLVYMIRIIKGLAWAHSYRVVQKYEPLSLEQSIIEIKTSPEHDWNNIWKTYSKDILGYPSYLLEEQEVWLKSIYLQELANAILHELSIRLPDRLHEGYDWVYEYSINKRDKEDVHILIKIWTERISR